MFTLYTLCQTDPARTHQCAFNGLLVNWLMCNVVVCMSWMCARWRCVERGGMLNTGLPSLSSSCGSMASMASMVAEGGGGEQVTPDKAMQMQSAALQQNKQQLTLGRMRYIYNVSHPQRSATCIITERISVNRESCQDRSVRRREGETEISRWEKRRADSRVAVTWREGRDDSFWPGAKCFIWKDVSLRVEHCSCSLTRPAQLSRLQPSVQHCCNTVETCAQQFHFNNYTACCNFIKLSEALVKNKY